MFNIDENRVFMNDNSGRLIAEVTFPYYDDDTVVIDHTFVDESLRGQGIAQRLMLAAVDTARKNGKKLRATCPYAVKWFDENYENYKDIFEK